MRERYLRLERAEKRQEGEEEGGDGGRSRRRRREEGQGSGDFENDHMVHPHDMTTIFG
jgi:hypothetical protein